MSRTKQSMQQELKQLYTNLNKIQEKIAVYGQLEAPLHWLNQRDQTQERIAELEELLRIGDLPDETSASDQSFNKEGRAGIHTGGAYIGGSVQTGGDFIGRDKIAQGDEVHGDKIIYQGSTYPRLNYRKDIADIITFYTQTFVGREREWVALTWFAGQETSGYRLIEAPAGYGKSALLAQMIHRHETGQWADSPLPHLLYFFIRQEGQRHTPEAFLQALNSQLLTLLNMLGGVPPDLSSLRGQFSELWAQALKLAGPERPLLLLLDGLDEQASGDVTIAHLLPAYLAPYVHIIVTSRPNPEPLQQIALEHPFRQASVLRLQTFSEGEIQQLIQQYGADSAIATRLAPRVLTLTRGEPLFARFVCQEVATEGEAALTSLEQDPPPNVEAYFRQQFRQLDTLAQGELIWQILGLLTVTLGSIAVEEIAQVLEVGKRPVRKAIEPIQRFLLGHPRLELMHLQLRKVVVEEFSPPERLVFREKILHWGRHYAAQDWPTETPDYLLAHYAQHLVEDGQHEALYALIDKRWMELKFKRTLSHRAFADDVEWAIKVAGKEEPSNWVQLTRVCLIYATFISLSDFAPPTALGVLTLIGHIERAKGYAALMENKHHQSRAYVSIGQALLARGEREEAITVLRQALEAVEAIDLEMIRVEALEDIVQIITQARDKAGLTRALEIVKAIQDEDYQLQGLCSVTLALIEMQEFGEALNIIETIKDEQIKDMLAELAQTKTVDVANEKEKVEARNLEIQNKSFTLDNLALGLTRMRQLDQALAVVNTIRDEEPKVHVLGKMAHMLARMGDKIGLNRVQTVIEAIKNDRDRASGLVSVAQGLVMVKEFDQAVMVAESIENRFWKLSALSEVAMALVQVEERTKAAELTNRVLMSTEAIGLEVDKASVLSKIAQALVKVKKLEYSLIVTEAIEDKPAKINAMVKVTQILIQMEDKHSAAAVANQARLIAEAIGDGWRKVDKLSEVAQVLMLIGNENEATKVIENALTIAEAIKVRSTEIAALNKLAESLAQLDKKDKAVEVINWALAAAEKIENNWQRSWQLNSIAHTLMQMMEADRALKVVNQALAAAEAIKDEFGKAYPLMETVQNLAQLGKFDQALTVAETIQKGDDKAFALSSIAHSLAQVRKFDQALTIAARIEFTYEKIRALSKIARILAQVEDRKRVKEIINQALEAIEAENDKNWKVSALSEVAQVIAEIEGNKRVVDVLSQAFVIANAIEHNIARSAALSTIIRVISQQLEASEQALRVLHTSLLTARLVGRKSVFEMLENGATILAALDQGETLWQVYQAVMEVEGWWESGRMKDET